MEELTNSLVAIKTITDEKEECEIEIIPTFAKSDEEHSDFENELNQKIENIEKEINIKDKKIESLVSHVDKLDCIVSVVCGVLTGILDSFFVGEFSLKEANEWGTEKCNNFVMFFANETAKKDPNRKGFDKFNDLSKAVEYLEKKYKVNYDSASNVLGNENHHLYDFAHHPSLLGLVISIFSQFSGKTFGCDKLGVLQWVSCDNSKVILQGNNFFEKFFNAISNWGGHLISDMIGTSKAVSKGNYGSGIPGPIMSMFQEYAGIFKKKDPKAQENLQNCLRDAFSGKLKGQDGIPFDFRTELGIYKHLGKQSLVVTMNEAIVRAFYMIRHLVIEIKDSKIKSFKELNKLNWKNVMPFKNRTIVRMLTISMSTMTAIDLADAAIRSTLKKGGFASFAIRVNYVGVIRTSVACVWDFVSGLQLEHNRNERIKLYNEYISLNNAKILYKQGELWQLVTDVDDFVNQTLEKAKESLKTTNDYYIELKDDIKNISNTIDKADELNEGLKSEIKDLLKWGI